MRGVLKSLVAVEMEFCSNLLLLFLHCKADGVQNQIHRLLCSGLISHDTVVVEVADHGQIQYALPDMNIEMSVIHLLLDRFAWKSLLSKFLYLSCISTPRRA